MGPFADSQGLKCKQNIFRLTFTTNLPTFVDKTKSDTSYFLGALYYSFLESGVLDVGMEPLL